MSDARATSFRAVREDEHLRVVNAYRGRWHKAVRERDCALDDFQYEREAKESARNDRDATQKELTRFKDLALFYKQFVPTEINELPYQEIADLTPRDIARFRHKHGFV